MITDWYVYDAYGMPVASLAPNTNPFRYGGQFGYYTLPTLNVICCGARWYDPQIGRWLSRDPIGYDGGSNLYEYCVGNPVRFGDPSGTSLISWCVKEGIEKLTKEALLKFIEFEIKSNAKKLLTKKFAKRFLQEANNIVGMLEDPWWVTAIGFIAVADDAFDLVNTCEKAGRAIKAANQLEHKVKAILEAEKLTAEALTDPKIRRSASWAGEFAQKTYAEIIRLADEGNKRASQMKKLIEQTERLREKIQ